MRFRLAQILDALEGAGLVVGVRGELPEFVDGLADDSRQVARDSLFIAIRGSARDGHDYLGRAAELGAAAAMLEDPDRTTLPAIIVREGR